MSASPSADSGQPHSSGFSLLLMRWQSMLWSSAGPGAFALAAHLGGRFEPGYRGRDEPISALAAKGASAAPVMIPGFLALSASSYGLGRELRGTRVAPRPIPELLTLAAITTAGAGLFRCSDRTCPTRFLGDHNVTLSDDLHAGFSGVSFALWTAIPAVAALRAVAAGPHYRMRCVQLASVTLAAFLGGGLLARAPSRHWSGAAQRVMLASALSWYPLAALTTCTESG